MNAMILLAQGAMNMADSLATANPVLTEVGTPVEHGCQGWLDYGSARSTLRSVLLYSVRAQLRYP